MRRRGFTLIETMISTAVFGLLVAIVLGLLIPTNRASEVARTESELSNLSQLAMARFGKDALSACALEASSSGALAVFRLNRYDASGDILAGQFDQAVYRVSENLFSYSRGAIVNQRLLAGIRDDVAPFRYFDANLQETTPASAMVVRLSLHPSMHTSHELVAPLQTRDFRLRNAR